MHRSAVLAIIISFLLFTECGPEVKYKVPQPNNRQNLDAIPDIFLGRYSNIADSTILEITKQAIYKIWKSNEQMPLDSIIKDLKFKVFSDTIINLNDGFKIEIKFTEDVKKVLVSAQEKLFNISDSNIIRKYRDYCFLNYKTKDGYWLVKILRMKGDYLEFTDLINSKDIDNIDNLTRVTTIKDTINNNPQEYQLNPSKRELRRILRSKKFEKEFIRLK